ncbi:hypothetical protein TNCV_4861651 [Trichonephila clavipes]|nr:hypothetical protein TNCV_4861651 [Trichonephila clavipes]
MYIKPVVALRPPIDMVWEFGEEVPAKVTSSSFDLGSKLRVDYETTGRFHLGKTCSENRQGSAAFSVSIETEAEESAEDNDRETATAGSDVVQSGRPIFDDFFQHLWPCIGNNTANVVFQMVQRLWLIRIDQ